MPYRRGDIFGRALVGLLVLVVLVLPVARAGAVMLPLFDGASYAALAGHDDDDRASVAFPAHSHSGSPRDGCEHPDGLTCCLSCGFLLGDLPSIQPAPRPQSAASLRFLMLSTSSPDGLASAPDLPPPRQIV